MAASIVYENDFIVGGKSTTKVTPNFRLGEYMSGGKVRVHRDVTAAVQVVRDTLGGPISISSLRASGGLGTGRSGLFAWLQPSRADQLEALEKEARKVAKDGWLDRVERAGTRVYVEIPNPEDPPPIQPAQALQNGILVSAGFETAGDPFQQVTGNFDGAGLSFGPLQVNFKTGTLQDLMQRYRNLDEPRLARCFGDDWEEWTRVLKLSRTRQVEWADALSLPGCNHSPRHSPKEACLRRGNFDRSWKARLQAVGREPRFKDETGRYAYDVYGRKLIVALAWLSGTCPHIEIDNFRCLAALYDLCVQQGSLNKAHDAIRKRVAKEDPQDQAHLVRIAVTERGKKASTRWRADCISRRLAILDRKPVSVTESGHTSRRSNRLLYLVRNVGVKNVEKYLL